MRNSGTRKPATKKTPTGGQKAAGLADDFGPAHDSLMERLGKKYLPGRAGPASPKKIAKRMGK